MSKIAARSAHGHERGSARSCEITFLPGLREVVTEELAPFARRVRPVPGREDAVLCSVSDVRALLGLRTAVAPFLLNTFDVPRPKSLLSGAYFSAITDAVSVARGLNSMRTFRIEAAGSDSAVFRRIASQLESATRLTEVATDGDCVIRFRRAVEGAGWDVLVRLSRRPLSARDWRVRGHPAAVNATIAAAMVRLSGPTPADRVANLMCGSGTLLVERLLAGPARSAVGVDSDPAAISAAEENTAGLDVELHTADIADWTGGPFDVIFADPPWGDKTGAHETNEKVHDLLLRKAFDLGAARLVVLTHEIRIMQRCLRRADVWSLQRELRVFAKGHHPRIYVLNRRNGR